jgi:non-ribosomal peptide synthetase component F
MTGCARSNPSKPKHAEARQYDYASLVEIQGWSEIPRGTSLFQSLVGFENYAANAFESACGSKLEPRGPNGALEGRLLASREQASFPLSLIVAPADELICRLSFQRSFISEDRAGQILHALDTLLGAFIETPSQTVSSLPVLTKEDVRQTVQLGIGNSETHSQQTALTRFAEQVLRTPDAIAVAFEDQQVSYCELDKRTSTSYR